MTPLSYAAAALPVRPDLPAAHERAWTRLAAPGAWWTGAERVSIAAECRNAWRCAVCRERKASLSPYAVSGVHADLGALPEPAVDAIHRITTDPGRVSRAWFERTLQAGLDEGAYVELVGVVVTVVSIDSFCRGLGVPPHPLPEPLAGPPSRYRPAAARPGEAWVAMLPAGRPPGAEADLWGPGIPNVARALSLVPDEVRTLKDLTRAHYLEPEQVVDPRNRRGALDRMQMELLAGRVSALRECFY